jgi:hypothetical protein
VQSDLFNANKVFSGRGVCGDSGRQLVQIEICELEGVESGAPFSDLLNGDTRDSVSCITFTLSTLRWKKDEP